MNLAWPRGLPASGQAELPETLWWQAAVLPNLQLLPSDDDGPRRGRATPPVLWVGEVLTELMTPLPPVALSPAG